MAQGQDTSTPEEKKYLAEAQKLAKESLPPNWLFRWGPFGPFLSAIAALAVVGTLVYSIWTYREGIIARQEERFRLATDALGSAEPAMRIIGVNKLRRFLDERKYREDTISLFAQLLLLEGNEDAVHVLAAALETAGRKHPKILLRETRPLKGRLLSKIIHTFSKKGKLLHAVNLLQDRLYLLAHVEKTASKQSLTLSRANFQCWRKLDADFKGSELADSIFWRADLYKADFTGSNLQRSLFMESNLSYAKFNGADLQDAKFKGAKLFNARFEGAKNIALDSFKDASWAWAHFDASIKERLENRFGKEQGKKDLRKEGREECNKNNQEQ